MIHVFISWSGQLSREVAAALRDWLPDALQFVKPYFSPNDIEKGVRWETMLTEELSKSSVGLFVMTKENLGSKWLHFEAGAISKSIDRAHVCTLLFGIEPTDIEGPLSGFQATKFEKDEFRRLFMTINAAGGDSKLPELNADRVFEKWWPELDKRLNEIIANHEPERAEIRSERDLIEEILRHVRNLSLDRSSSRSPPSNPRLTEFLNISDFIGMRDADRSWVPVVITLKNRNAREVEIEKEDLLMTLKALPHVKLFPQEDSNNVDQIEILVRANLAQQVITGIRSEHPDINMHIDVPVS
ncbi:MAG TPA: TIR domain-containing protein [Pseudolabrys sp.]|uniref:TIR domain-containing protein n=1 Tax=Pseudolabrys sp. TaxID=1960880 RepID=UPI002DDD14CE|nr:TIR domain-containing protein [Pseudolabrys sp.]HEV2627414.1 TIR domain-containing protein [Pseudolabrys sp.]